MREHAPVSFCCVANRNGFREIKSMMLARAGTIDMQQILRHVPALRVIEVLHFFECWRKVGANPSQFSKQRKRRGNVNMNKFALVSAFAILAGMISPAFADCDTRKADEDKQAAAASKCYDEYLSRKQNYGANKDELRTNFHACNEKAGCPQNSDLLK